MFGFISGILYWLLSTVLGVAFYFAEHIIEWILPIYMTTYIIRAGEQSKYNNYMCFWFFASVLFLIDCLTGFILYHFYFYRLLRFLFILWIQIDGCHNSVYLMQFISPSIDYYRTLIDEMLTIVQPNIDKLSSNVMENVKGFILNSGSKITNSVANVATNVTASVKQTAQTLHSNKNNNDNDNNNNNTNTNTNTNTSTNTNTNTANDNMVSKQNTDDINTKEKSTTSNENVNQTNNKMMEN